MSSVNGCGYRRSRLSPRERLYPRDLPLAADPTYREPMQRLARALHASLLQSLIAANRDKIIHSVETATPMFGAPG